MPRQTWSRTWVALLTAKGEPFELTCFAGSSSYNRKKSVSLVRGPRDSSGLINGVIVRIAVQYSPRGLQAAYYALWSDSRPRRVHARHHPWSEKRDKLAFYRDVTLSLRAWAAFTAPRYTRSATSGPPAGHAPKAPANTPETRGISSFSRRVYGVVIATSSARS